MSTEIKPKDLIVLQEINLIDGCKLQMVADDSKLAVRWWFKHPVHAPIRIGALEAQNLITAASAGLLEDC